MKRLIVAAAAVALLAGQAQAAAPKKHAAPAAGGSAGWTFTDTKTPMGDRTQRACTASKNLAKLSAPYSPTRVRLCFTLDTNDSTLHAVRGRLELVAPGQFTGDSTRFKFDNDPPLSVDADRSDSNATLFLDPTQGVRLARRALSSKTLVVEVRFFEAGTQFLEFDTENMKFPNPGLDIFERMDRDRELKEANGDQAKVEAINAKYDCIAAGREGCPK